MNQNDDVRQNSQLSIYGNEEALNEFPVLKAFQQYIDAEQAKAHKRVSQLCIFFAALMAIIVSVFVVLLISVSSKNSELSGQMLALMMKERSAQAAQPVIIQPSQQAQPSNGADERYIREISSLVEKISGKMNMIESSIKDNATNVAQEENRAKSLRESLDRQSSALKKREMDVAREKQSMESERMKIEQEKALLAKQKEELRQKEIELQRRKLYPELYDTPGATAKPKAAANEKPQKPQANSDSLSEEDEEIDELIDMIPINYFSDEEPVKKKEAPARKTSVKTAKRNVAPTANAKPVKQNKPVQKKEESISIDEADYSWDIPLD